MEPETEMVSRASWISSIEFQRPINNNFCNKFKAKSNKISLISAN